MVKVNRQKKHSKPTLRQRQAQATADTIVAAGRELFLELGYSNTTIEAIAARAGVAVSTVYAVFGSKRGILRAIRTPWHEASSIRKVTYGDPGRSSPEERLKQLAEATRRQWETGSEVVTIYQGAAAADPEAAAELKQALEGRRKGMENFARHLGGSLRPGLEAEEAAAILRALCLAEVFQELVRNSGWSLEKYQAWLEKALRRDLLGK